jgi:hypothetical protein
VSAPPEKSVLLIKRDVMTAPILDEPERERLAASFLAGPIGAGAEVLIPGTLEGAAWRLRIAFTTDCDEQAMCSLPRASPRH